MIALDTELFEQLALNLNDEFLTILRGHCAIGDAEILLSDITCREVASHIDARVDAALSKVNQVLDRFGIARRLAECGQDAHRALWEKTRTGAQTAWREFQSSVTVVTASHADVGDILDRYFAGKAPFQTGHKKSEFPDAIALDSLLECARAAGRTLLVVSNDPDWKMRCTGVASVEVFERLEPLLERLLGDDGLFRGRFELWQREPAPGNDIALALWSELNHLEFVVDESAGELLSHSVSAVSIESFHVVKLASDVAVVALEATARLAVDMRWIEYVQEDSFYDEDDLVVPDREATETQDASLRFSAVAEVKVQDGRPKELVGVRLKGGDVLHLRSGSNDYQL
jgi:hypothetical protein